MLDTGSTKARLKRKKLESNNEKRTGIMREIGMEEVWDKNGEKGTITLDVLL